jgi:hypothetical protein
MESTTSLEGAHALQILTLEPESDDWFCRSSIAWQLPRSRGHPVQGFIGENGSFVNQRLGELVGLEN